MSCMKLLSLDLSTTNTGYAKIDIASKCIVQMGNVKSKIKNPTKKGIPLYKYPIYQKLKIASIVEQLIILINDPEVTEIVIEEINRGKARLSQKILDGLHHVLLDRLTIPQALKITYVDSDGENGWRSRNGLNLILTEKDKLYNKEARKYNNMLKKSKSKGKKRPLITAKTLACRYVNKEYNLELDDWARKTDEDLADALGLGYFYLTFWRTKW